MRSTYGMKKPGSMGKTASPVKPPTPGPLPAASTRPPAPGVNPTPNPNSGMGNQGGPPPTPVYSNQTSGMGNQGGPSGVFSPHGGVDRTPKMYGPNQTSGVTAPTNGVAGLSPYDTMAQQDMEAAQRDRDVSRAASMREMREGAINQGIGPGTQRYQAMARDAEAGANQYGQQSRNAAANRAQGLMMDKKEDQEEQTNNYVNTLSENEQRAFLDLRASGMNDIDALKAMKSMDIKQNNAFDDIKEGKIEDAMERKNMSREAATAFINAKDTDEFDTDFKDFQDKQEQAALIPVVNQKTMELNNDIEAALPRYHAALRAGTIRATHTSEEDVISLLVSNATASWTANEWQTAKDNDLVPKRGIGRAVPISADSPPTKFTRNYGVGQVKNYNGEYYKVTSMTISRGDKGSHKGGQIIMLPLTGPLAQEGEEINFFDLKKAGTI